MISVDYHHQVEFLTELILRIMEARKGQENFQLIVITHDERFAHLIGQRQLAEKYYRVSKDVMERIIVVFLQS